MNSISETMQTGAIILAAGSSSRMGQSKQMLDIDGEKLLSRTTRAALDAGLQQVVVVVGYDDVAHRKILAGLPVEIVHNSRWKNGMGSSLKAGLTHLLSMNPALNAVIVSVCDQPLLNSRIFIDLVHKFHETQKPVIASRYSNMPGVPALFDKRYFAKLAALPDDQGAKRILLQNPGDVEQVDFPGGEIDLDTMEDYDAFMEGRS